MTENENVRSDELKQDQSITTDDLIFALGDKEAFLIQKNKYIQRLENQIKNLASRLYQQNNDRASSAEFSKEIERYKSDISDLSKVNEKLSEEKNKLSEENRKLKESIDQLKEKNNELGSKIKKQYDLQKDNERLSRLIKEKDKRIKDLENDNEAVDGMYFSNGE